MIGGAVIFVSAVFLGFMLGYFTAATVSISKEDDLHR